MATLTAALIVRDEEHNIPDLMASLAPHVDRIVIVDTGSTDRTVELALEHGAEVGHFTWCNDFAAARNAALDLVGASGWVLSVDADERLRIPDGTDLRAALDSLPEAVHAIQIANMLPDGRHMTFRGPRLFPAGRARWSGAVHEQPAWSSSPAPDTRACDLFVIEHYGYMPEVVTGRGKTARNLELARVRYDQENGAPAAQFELGRALVNNDLHEEGVPHLLASRRRFPAGSEVWKTAGIMACIALDSLDEPEQGLSAARDGGAVCLELRLWETHFLLRLHRSKDALAALVDGWDLPMHFEATVTRDWAWALRAHCLAALGQPEDAWKAAAHVPSDTRYDQALRAILNTGRAAWRSRGDITYISALLERRVSGKPTTCGPVEDLLLTGWLARAGADPVLHPGIEDAMSQAPDTPDQMLEFLQGLSHQHPTLVLAAATLLGEAVPDDTAVNDLVTACWLWCCDIPAAAEWARSRTAHGDLTAAAAGY